VVFQQAVKWVLQKAFMMWKEKMFCIRPLYLPGKAARHCHMHRCAYHYYHYYYVLLYADRHQHVYHYYVRTVITMYYYYEENYYVLLLQLKRGSYEYYYYEGKKVLHLTALSTGQGGSTLPYAHLYD
jgi:hypothetical protein